MNDDMNPALIFMGVCASLGVGMILWRAVVSEAIRDRRIFLLAKNAKANSQPLEVKIHLIPIKRKCGYMPDGLHFDIESNGQHWYFSSCTLMTPLPKDGERCKMYVLPTENIKACYIELNSGELLGVLSEELPDDTGGKTDIQSLKDAEWKSMYS